MNGFRLPNIVSSGLLAVLLFGLQWALGHIGEFGIAPAYLTIVTGLLGVAIAAVAKMIQEPTKPDPQIMARGMGEKQHGYLTRVLIK